MMLTAFAGRWRRRGWSGRRSPPDANITGLLLAGVVVNAFLSSVIMFLTSIARADQVQTTMFWLMGSISEMQQVEVIAASGLLTAAGVGVLLRLGPSLNMLSFGADEAAALGLSVSRTCAAAFAVAADDRWPSALGGLVRFRADRPARRASGQRAGSSAVDPGQRAVARRLSSSPTRSRGS